MTASAARAPPLVAPSDSTSTPLRQVISAGVALSRTSALAKRAPSMCTASDRCRAICASAAISFGGLRDRQRRWNDLMRTVTAITGRRLAEAIGGDLAGHISEKFGRPAFVGENVRSGMTENGAPGRRDLRQSQSVCRRAGWRQESRHATFEDLAEPALGRLCPIIIAIAAARLGQSIENGGCDRRRVVASKVHLWRT